MFSVCITSLFSLLSVAFAVKYLFAGAVLPAALLARSRSRVAAGR